MTVPSKAGAIAADEHFGEYLSQFPDALKVAQAVKTKEGAVKEYESAIGGVGGSFVDRVKNEKLEIAKQLETPRNQLKEKKSQLDGLLFDEKWLSFRNTASSDYRTRIRNEGESLAAYKDSGNVGAIKNAASLIDGLLKKCWDSSTEPT